METFALLLIVISALMHALWNLLVKQSRDKTVFIWWMFVTSWSLMVVAAILSPESHASGLLALLDWKMAALSASAALCFVLYHWLCGYAYRDGDLSVTYPLAQTSMLYVPIWGVVLLGEQLSASGTMGILLIVLGAYAVQLRRVTLAEVIFPLTQVRTRSVQAALMAGFVYSIGAILDKTGVSYYPVFEFTFVLVFFMLLIMSLNLLRPCYRGRIVAELCHSPKLVLCSGPVMLASFLTFRFGLQLAPVSYAVPVRQVSLLIGVAIGVLFLGESCGRIRLIAASLILLGVLFIRLG